MGKRKNVVSVRTILDLDYEMRNAFEREAKRVPEIKKQISKIEELLSEKSTKLRRSPKKIPPGKRQNLNRQLTTLKEQLDDISRNISLCEYSIETSEVICEYKQLLETKQTTAFVGGKKGKSLETKKKALEDTYLSIARTFDVFGILPTNTKSEIVCDNCGGKDLEFHDDRLYICSCGAVKEIETNTGCYKDCSRTNTSTDYQYERRLHFKDTIDRYCGKQNKAPKKEVCEKIIEALYRYKIIDTLTPDNWDNVTKSHIIMILKEDKLDEYNDAQLYHTYITGQPGPDLSYIQKELFEDHDKITEVYRPLMEELIEESNGRWDRTSFLNGEYVLYQLLKRHCHECDKSEFRMLKTHDPLVFHDIMYSRICKEFGWTMEKLA